ncbi:hypothetical protein GOBAR_DD04603 [Gossypium barbadense]|nr:hypothetical protein GOBAR_DD04603 [Gossypium barbadense]
MGICMLFYFMLQLPWLIRAASSDCHETCGSVVIRYPFGIRTGCYYNPWFRVTCNQTTNGPKPFISRINLELLHHFPKSGDIVFVNNPVIYLNCDNKGNNGTTSSASVNLQGSPFFFSSRFNRLGSVGCGYLAAIFHDNLTDPIASCLQQRCSDQTSEFSLYRRRGTTFTTCYAPISEDIISYTASVTEVINTGPESNRCKSVFINYNNYLVSYLSEMKDVAVSDFFRGISIRTTHVPAVLEWNPCDLGGLNRYCYMLCVDAFGSNCSSSTSCPDGYEYSDGREMCVRKTRISYDPSFFSKKKSQKFPIIIGCSTSIGTVFALLGTWRLYKVLERRKDIKLKHKYFKRNGGLLLQQRFSNNDGNVENIHVFASNVLEKATDYYNDNRILGRGGQGTVYKGMLTDGSIVAIKKPILKEEKILDEKKLEQFINEVILLSQINHRNVVKLLGCCLETKVPLLVYEFIPNGTLYQLIHEPNEEFPLNWEMRLRITSEIANALSYLHSAASVPIYHRDIKSSNILLDDKYRAKVSDFGTSKSIALEKTHVTTRVQGTFGYLDPEYFRSSQFTEKSDVYSFGVVLVEVLTGQKPVFSTQSEDEVRSLVAFFLLSMQNDSLFEILDQTVKDGPKTEIEAFAKLAKRCLNLNGKKRPTMKQVALELEWIRSPAEADGIEQCADEDSDIDDPIELSATDSCSTSGLILNDSIGGTLTVIRFHLEVGYPDGDCRTGMPFWIILLFLVSDVAAKVINPGRKRCTSAFITYIDFRMSRSKDVSTADTVNFSDISIDTTHVPAVLEWNLYDLEAAQCLEGTLPYLQLGCRVTYNETIDGPKLYTSSINLQLLNVSVLQGTATINNSITYFNCRKEDGDTDGDTYFSSAFIVDHCQDREYCWTSLSLSYLCVFTWGNNGNINISTDICKGCSACIGTTFAVVGAWCLHKVLNRRKYIKLKQKYFKRNGGLLLQQQLSNNGCNVEKIQLFASNELEKATDHYNENRILGRGGQGIVYKGMLTDGSIVAIKKPKLVEENMLDEMRLEQFIMSETANALSYLHSAASIPIYHRGIKSSNILLDDKYRAKVSDFGTSKSIALEETHDKNPFFSTQSEEEVRSLVTFFLLSVQKDSLFDVLDQTLMYAPEEDIEAFAKLAKRCLNLNGKKRPTMKQAALQLEWIRSPGEANAIEQCADEDSDIDDTIELSATASYSTSGLILNDSVTLILDA